jgi:hypothetical protein
MEAKLGYGIELVQLQKVVNPALQRAFAAERRRLAQRQVAPGLAASL